MNNAWLLDTCVFSELARSAPDAVVLRWMKQNAGHCAMAAVTIGELSHGIERLAPGRRRNELQLWFDALCGHYASRILGTDEAVWRAFGRIKGSLEAVGRPKDDFDVLIAATAAVHQLTLVTRNTRHFEDSGVRTLNPWIAS
jgi:predicted nucleic acid-binding protein